MAARHSIGLDRRFASTFGKNLARCRRAKGISQEELGFLADLHRTEVGQIERGLRVPRSDTLLKLYGSLDVSPVDLFKGMSWTPADFSYGRLEVRTADSESS